MENITLNTSNVGTFNLEYKAIDESGNTATNNRNVFILRNEGSASIELEGSSYLGINATSFAADERDFLTTTAGSAGDPGFIALDQYNNNVNEYVRIQHFKHLNMASVGVLIYDTDDLVTYDQPITNNNDPQDMWFFNSVGDPPPRDPLDPVNELNLSKSNLSAWGLPEYATYYSVKYSLDLPGMNSIIEKQRIVHIRDNMAPVFTLTLSNYSVAEGDPAGIVATNETNAKTKFNYQENYWFISGKLPTNAGSGDSQDNDRIGFTVEDVEYVSPNGNVTTTDPNQISGTDGTWTAYHRFKCSYKNSANKVINYLADSDETIYERTQKLYEVTRTITVNEDESDPVIKFLEIDLTYGTDGTIKTSSGGGTDNTGSDTYGTITITVPTQIGNTLDDLSLAAALGDNNDNFKNDTDQSPVEIEVTDTVASSLNISYIITQQTLNFQTPDDVRNIIKRTHIGTDFSQLFNNYTIKPKIAGTAVPNAPAIFIITYTAKDGDNNTSTATRTIEIIDPTPPNIAFSVNANNKYGTGLSFQKDSGTNKEKTVNVETATVIQDNFGDLISKSLVQNETTPKFRAAYPKNKLDNIFKIKHSPSMGYLLYDLYDNQLNGSQVLYMNDKNNNGTIYYFDLSDTTLASAGDSSKIYRFFVGNTKITELNADNVSYTPIGSYNAYMQIDAANLSNGNVIVIKKADSESASFTPLAFNSTSNPTFTVSNA